MASTDKSARIAFSFRPQRHVCGARRPNLASRQTTGLSNLFGRKREKTKKCAKQKTTDRQKTSTHFVGLFSYLWLAGRYLQEKIAPKIRKKKKSNKNERSVSSKTHHRTNILHKNKKRSASGKFEPKTSLWLEGHVPFCCCRFFFFFFGVRTKRENRQGGNFHAILLSFFLNRFFVRSVVIGGGVLCGVVLCGLLAAGCTTACACLCA